MSKHSVLILAAGQGTRMSSTLAKVLHPVCGKPMVNWVVDAARASAAEKVVVIDSPSRVAESVLGPEIELAVQRQALGTGDAVGAGLSERELSDTVVVLSGDVPLVTAEFITELITRHREQSAVATVVTMKLDDPAGYGRVVRSDDGSVQRIVETKKPGDATPQELEIDEVNAGIYAFATEQLRETLKAVKPDNAQGEYYLPDVLPLMIEAGGRVAAYQLADPTLALGVNDRVDLAHVSELAQQRIQRQHMQAGVTIISPHSTQIEVGVTVGKDTVIEPGSYLRGNTEIGANCVIGPHTTVTDSRVGDGSVVEHSYLRSCELSNDCSVGPFAYLRPDAKLGERAKAGAFVEIKNSTLGSGAKVPHLSYIGDADVGEQSNLGAGTITANYDGHKKHRTKIGARVRGGVDTAFVAPVEVGDDAYTAAGSVITEDVPPGSLGVARERQANVEGYAERQRNLGKK